MKLSEEEDELEKMQARFWSKVKIGEPDECWEWQASRLPFGYGQFMMPDWKIWKAHRVAWYLVNGPIPAGKCVLHRCDNPPCVNVAHLFLGSQLDNSLDMRRKGRGARLQGVMLGTAKLDEEAVTRIRRDYDKGGGVTLAVLAKRHGVSVTSVNNVLLGRTWRHVKP